jgi:predicted SprT family Zn-dependent metalloprotease
MLTKQEVTEFALDEIAKHGLTCRLKWTRAKGYLGQASWVKQRGKITCSKISLSELWLDALDNKNEMLDTVLHEIAHALANEQYNESCGHDYRWKQIARELGAKPQACAYGVGYDQHKINAQSKYRADCRCGNQYFFNRMGKHWQNGNYHCAKCKGKLKITQQR